MTFGVAGGTGQEPTPAEECRSCPPVAVSCHALSRSSHRNRAGRCQEETGQLPGAKAGKAPPVPLAGDLHHAAPH